MRIFLFSLALLVANFVHATTQTFTGTVAGKTVTQSGTQADPLVMDFTQATVTGPIKVSGVSYVTFKGGTFASSVNGACFDFGSSQSGNVTISGWTYTGPANGTTSFVSGYFCYNLLLENNRIDNVSHFSMSDSTLSHDITIRNNYCRTSTNTATQTDVVFYGDSFNVLIEGNQFINRAPGATQGNHNDIIQTYQKGGGNAGNPKNWTVRYNWLEIQQNSGSGDNSWTMIEAMGGDPALKMYGNVFVGTGSVGNNGACFNSNTSAATFYCYNNTFIRRGSPDNTVRYLSPGNVHFRNNVMQSASANGGTWLVLSMKAASAFDYNFFYNSDGSAGAGPHGSTSKDPMFANFAGNDFALKAGSPLIGAGDSALGTEYSQGIAPGATWPNPALRTRKAGAWDVGAYVYAGSAPSPTPSPSATPRPSATPSPSATPPSTKFSIGDSVQTTTVDAAVRDAAAGEVIGVQPQGTVGQVIGGPTWMASNPAILDGVATFWWQISFPNEPKNGWLGEIVLAPATTPTPTPTPTPPQPTPSPSPNAPTFENWIQKQNDWIRANPPVADPVTQEAEPVPEPAP